MNRATRLPLATIVVLLVAAPIGAVLAVCGGYMLWVAGYVAGGVAWGALTGALALVMGAVAVVGARRH